MELLRRRSLDAGHLLDIRADLEDRAGLRATRELRVRDFVGPGTEVTGRLHPEQEVRMAAPPTVEERRLVDDVGAVAHRGFGFGGRRAELVAGGRSGTVAADLHDLATADPQLLEVALLVREA